MDTYTILLTIFEVLSVVLPVILTIYQLHKERQDKRKKESEPSASTSTAHFDGVDIDIHFGISIHKT